MAGARVCVTLQQFCETDDRPLRLLREAGFSVRLNTLGRRPLAADLPELLRDADGVLAGVEPYGAALFDQAPALRCISRCGIGTDAIDLAEAARRGIEVFVTPEETVEPVAQLTVAMILALARNLPWHLQDARAGAWTKRTGRLLSEWTIGLIGFGNIGQVVARCLRPFSPRILVCDPALMGAPLPHHVAACSLPELLAASDVVSLHASRRQDAGPLIGAAELAMMRKGSYLVNTARGYLVDEAALLAGLESGHLAGAALDVYGAEPYSGPLARLPQVICTPHVATLTRASRAAMEHRAARHLVEFFAARKPAAAAAGAR
jgi:D-3-phosphoglycerate dehydrogenase